MAHAKPPGQKYIFWHISSSYAKILGETNFQPREIPQSVSKAKEGEKRQKTRWVCRATLGLGWGCGWVGLGLGWCWVGIGSGLGRGWVGDMAIFGKIKHWKLGGWAGGGGLLWSIIMPSLAQPTGFSHRA